MSSPDSAFPLNTPADLAKPSFAYQLRVWAAMLGLLLFVIIYFGLAGWFTYTAYRMIVGTLVGGKVR